MDPTWFGGDGPRDAAEARFLDRLREKAPSWGVPGLNPDRTRTLARIVPLLLTVDVPGLGRETPRSHRLTQLQVGYWQAGPYGHGLEGEWGCESVLDNHRYDTDGLTVIGIDAEPEDFASWAADWLCRQLSRSRERQEWIRQGQVFASRTRLADSGLVLFTEGSILPRLLRRSPDRVVPLRVE